MRIPLAKLPAAADGYTIVQLTDIHIGPLLGDRFAARVAARVNALAPDLIVITGDLVDGNLDELRTHIAPLRRLRARDGVYAVTGAATTSTTGTRPRGSSTCARSASTSLRNEHVVIHEAFALAGADDPVLHAEDVPRALAGHDPALPVVLLAHHPSTIARADPRRGRSPALRPHARRPAPAARLASSRLFEPRVAGLAKFGATWLYVSCGNGFWGPPMRASGPRRRSRTSTLVEAA